MLLKRCFKPFKKGRRGISPIVATMLIFSIIIVGVAAGVILILPLVDRMNDESTIRSMENHFLEFDEGILSISRQGVNAKTVIDVYMDDGRLLFSDGDSIGLILSLEGTGLPNQTIVTDTSLGSLDYRLDVSRNLIGLEAGESRYVNGPDRSVPRSFVIGSNPKYPHISNVTESRDSDGVGYQVSLNYRVVVVVGNDTTSGIMTVTVYMIKLVETGPSLLSTTGVVRESYSLIAMNNGTTQTTQKFTTSGLTRLVISASINGVDDSEVPYNFATTNSEVVVNTIMTEVLVSHTT